MPDEDVSAAAIASYRRKAVANNPCGPKTRFRYFLKNKLTRNSNI